LIDASTLEIRPAERTDAPAISVLLHELGYPSSNTDEEVTGRLARWSGRDDLLALVAADGGQVVGVGALVVAPFFERPGNWGRVVALVVDSRMRGLGIGRRLLAATEQAAVDRGCVRMEITSSRHRTGAHAFYGSVGYTDWCGNAARFLKDLDTPS
jgi:GNAT superfamily N-acetyltransferase